RHAGHERACPRHLFGRLRRSARTVTRRQAARLDVKPLGWIRRTIVPCAMESRKGARSIEERAAQETEQEVMKRRLVLAGARGIFVVTVAVAAWLQPLSGSGHIGQGSATSSKTRNDVEALASARMEGRLTGSEGERLASEYLIGELGKIGAKPL